jgi:asparagine synthase (glutamine-hydrolysing)
MCGILGMASDARVTQLPGTDRLRNALATLLHRGPDANGEYREGELWLGHTRLSILDLSDAGAQPMQSADGRHVITYNGEIYNFKELARRHALAGLRSSSDTEVVLRLFAQRGIASLAELNGMFAFAIYDREARKLWLARDRFGIKPLYYSLQGNALRFGSEIKAVLALDDGARHCDTAALHEWLYFGNALGERTLYDGVRQLLPGCYLELELDAFRCNIQAFWSPERVSQDLPKRGSVDADVATTRTLLEQAVQRQLVSDVPVGVFLSGGVDSSAITAFASRAYGKLATYSAGFDFGDTDAELLKARMIARLNGTEHHEMYICGQDAGALVEKMVRAHDAPFADPANIPLYLMAKEISGRTKVVLQGDGGDELFGGYRRYGSLAHYRALHCCAAAAGGTLPLMPGALRERARRYLGAFASKDIGTTMALLLTPENQANLPESVFAPELRAALLGTDPFAYVRACADRYPSEDVVNLMSAVDFATTLPDLYLEKVDRSTMAASLEIRVPFLDNELVEFVRALPSVRKLPRGKRKWLLKSALRGVVPDEILFGPKVGLDVPFAQWLRGALRELFLDHLSSFARDCPGVLDSARVGVLYEQHCAGVPGQSYLLWKVLNFMIWARGAKVRFAESAVR